MSTAARPRRNLAGQAEHRRAVRYVAAALSAACAAVYFAIGFGLVYPVEPAADAPSLLLFGIPAGLAYAVGFALLLGVDRLGPWIMGAILQVLVIVLYVMVAEKRSPPFEAWGILLKVAQAAILASLVWLILAPGGRCPCAYCDHHRNLHKGRCLVPACGCEIFL
jgi:hypothetical protein